MNRLFSITNNHRIMNNIQCKINKIEKHRIGHKRKLTWSLPNFYCFLCRLNFPQKSFNTSKHSR